MKTAVINKKQEELIFWGLEVCMILGRGVKDGSGSYRDMVYEKSSVK